MAEYCMCLASARALNAAASRDGASLYPLPLPNGTMPGEIFPATLGYFKALPDITGLVERYKIEISDVFSGLGVKRALVALHFGIHAYLAARSRGVVVPYGALYISAETGFCYEHLCVLARLTRAATHNLALSWIELRSLVLIRAWSIRAVSPKD
ncbi:hypothetical protein RSOLAG22IIIB_09709 [Rhizoctonia solani]|uniref:Uncharacterized protein n=1 Tax=Rhizoctonia solani TaxID=456999 RepID=A0A0K6FZB3_9AGAM|nr:hypothetical protein RSOLAG22IIIB_09709 [Rhizoctonia solani]